MDKLIVELLIDEEHTNCKKTLHGGQTAALTDIITSLHTAVVVRDKAFVSVELSAVKIGELIEIESKIIRIGRKLIFTEIEFRRKFDGAIVVKGKHLLSLVNNANNANYNEILR